METAKTASPIFGNKLYQERARAALPKLVRQARAGAEIEYGQLATEMDISNPRTLNYVLGCIGQTLIRLSEEWGERIPSLQCLVVNKHTRLPGAGIGWFITPKDNFRKMSLQAKRRLVKVNAEEVFAYRHWPKVLRALELREDNILPQPIERMTKTPFGGGGESEQHRKLKEYVATHPEIVALPHSIRGKTEYPLLSGDAVDVCFEWKEQIVAVEVKSAISMNDDIVRGIFQCVKYRAVVQASQAVSHKNRNTRVVLALESKLPRNSCL